MILRRTNTIKNRKIFKKAFCYGFSIICTLLTVTVCAEKVEICFKDSVVVCDTSILLGDIASINTSDVSLLAQMQKFKIGESAPAGYSRFINCDDLIAWYLNPRFPTCTFTKNQLIRTRVLTSSVEKKVGEFSKNIETFLLKELTWPEGSVTIKITNPETAFKCYTSEIKTSFAGLMNRFAKGNTSIQMMIHQGTRSLRIPVMCHITVVVPVVYVKESINRNQLITDDLCKLRLEDITSYATVPCMSLSDVSGKRAKCIISENKIINKHHLEYPGDVEKNDRVSLVTKNKSVRIAIDAVARESGMIGEKIWVENTNSHKLVRGTITAKGVVSPL
jgi:flagella basal body P-ring formation protein FlgA